VLTRDDILDTIGADHIHDDVNQAVETQRSASPHPTADVVSGVGL